MRTLIIILIILSPTIFLSVKGYLDTEPVGVDKDEIVIHPYFICYEKLTNEGVHYKTKIEECNKLYEEEKEN